MKELSKDEEIVRRNLKAKPDIINPTDKLLNTLKSYEKFRVAQKNYGVHSMKIEDAICDAQNFLHYYYRLHKVNTLCIYKLLNHQIYFGRKIYPLKLPINLIKSNDIFFGSVTEIFPKDNDPIIFYEVNLNKQSTEQTSSSYVHEITHTQVDSLKGSLEEYYNVEVLSIFNELFHASILDKDEKILRLNDSRRIYEMSITAQELRKNFDGKNNMDRNELLDCCKYLISDLKAYDLFVTFYNANNSVKDEILDDVQSVFDGIITVEELLAKYDVTLDSIEDSPKMLKYFKR